MSENDLSDLRPGSIKTKRDLEKILKRYGFYLVRQKKHEVWRCGNRNLTVPSTASDKRYMANLVSTIRKIVIDLNNEKTLEENKNIDFPEL